MRSYYKEIYVADDGTEFEDEDDCLDYENGAFANQAKGKLILLDSFNRPIALNNPCDWDRASFLFSTMEGELAEKFTEKYSEYVYDVPDVCAHKGLWFYDSDHDEWKHYSQEIERLEAESESIMLAVNKMLRD